MSNKVTKQKRYNPNNIVDEYLYEVWLDNSYGGAPDECSECYRDGKIVKIVECEEHFDVYQRR